MYGMVWMAYYKRMVHIFLMNFLSDEMTSAWCSPSGKGAAHEWQLKILCNTIQILSSWWHLLKIARCHDDILQQLPHLKMESGALQDITDDEFELKDDWKLSATQYKIVRGSDDMLQERERGRGLIITNKLQFLSSCYQIVSTWYKEIVSALMMTNLGLKIMDTLYR